MAMPDFEDLTDRLFCTCEQMLGDTIQYRSAGGEFREIKATVDYGEMLRDAGTGQFIDNDVTISVLKTTLPDRPTKDDLVKLPKMAAAVLRPINTLDMGREWLFGVQRV
jgi:hypothetical protein